MIADLYYTKNVDLPTSADTGALPAGLAAVVTDVSPDSGSVLIVLGADASIGAVGAGAIASVAGVTTGAAEEVDGLVLSSNMSRLVAMSS
jgi:hypothetical protein